MLMSTKELEQKCLEIRKATLKMCLNAGTGHVTSSFSAIEILVTLFYNKILKYNPADPKSDNRDRFIMSKAQASPALYAILADLNFFPSTHLDKFATNGAAFGVHLQNTVPGVELTAGALGHGLGVAAGMAQALMMDRKLNLVYCLLGDGELYEGSIWESLLYISHHQLNNLIIIIDRNYLCTTDFTENLIALEPLDDKMKAMGFMVRRIDGHSIEQLSSVLMHLKSRPHRTPTIIIADTVKGKGLDCMSYDPLCHGIAPSGEVAKQAKKELGLT
jgi:transketolase